MKTLIFNGSPKKNGDTAALINEMVLHFKGDVRIISCRNNIQPCNDCRYCWESAGCSINDEMQEIYPFIQECDNIIIASPIWFSSLSGPFLNLVSRLQTIWAAGYFRKEPSYIKQKNGAVIIVGAQKGTEEIPTKTALTIMRYLNVRLKNVEKIYSLNTNNMPAENDSEALLKCRETAELLNSLCI